MGEIASVAECRREPTCGRRPRLPYVKSHGVDEVNAIPEISQPQGICPGTSTYVQYGRRRRRQEPLQEFLRSSELDGRRSLAQPILLVPGAIVLCERAIAHPGYRMPPGPWPLDRPPMYAVVGDRRHAAMSRRGLGPLLFQNLGAQIDTVFADEDIRWAGDEPAVPVGPLLPAEGADGVEVRAGTGSLPGHDVSLPHRPDASRRDGSRMYVPVE
jgi:hypothetical protein